MGGRGEANWASRAFAVRARSALALGSRLPCAQPLAWRRHIYFGCANPAKGLTTEYSDESSDTRRDCSTPRRFRSIYILRTDAPGRDRTHKGGGQVLRVV